ncbi:hypothetical protein [Streptomyces sp. McG3]|uniref:hypothetical protein n=1 Tax=Streptomyces sp. McG3 TaxID=2725483 RepID=UPI001BECE1D8|nr:hypothetical protein [Streptomyces sp. McG3]MBT2896258.1 hypothetical protein [Streptomyces sp. McG3]
MYGIQRADGPSWTCSERTGAFTGVGAVWIVWQSLTVGGFAALQYVGLKRL